MAKIEGDLRKEVEVQVNGLMHIFEAAAWDAFEDTKQKLKSHITSDVYDQWDPTEYVRRGENGGLGDMAYNTRGTKEPYTETKGDNIAAGFNLRFMPDGASEQWDEPLNGDWFTKRVESGEGYEWKKHPGPRPFWTNLIEELIDGNGYGDIVQRSLQMYGVNVDGFIEVRRSRDGWSNGEL